MFNADWLVLHQHIPVTLPEFRNSYQYTQAKLCVDIIVTLYLLFSAERFSQAF